MSFEMNKFDVVKKKQLEKSQFEVECNIDANADVTKILAINHAAQVEKIEVGNGEINYQGFIILSVLYSTGENEIGSLNSSCPFTSKFVDAEIKQGMVVSINVSVENSEVTSVNEGNIKILCKCEQSGDLICVKTIETVMPEDEHICKKEDEIPVNTFIGSAKETVDITCNVDIKEPLKKLVYADSNVFVKDVESGENFVSINGEVVTKILYLSENDRFETCYVSENFKEEVSLEGVTRESVSVANASINKNAVKVTIEEVEKGAKIEIKSPVCVEIFAYQEKDEKVVNDLYSTTHKLKTTTSSFEMTQNLCSENFETKIDGTLTLDDDKPRVDKLMFTSPTNVHVTNTYIKNGEIYVEGIAQTNVVYLNDEMGELFSVLMEVPFVVSEKTSVEDENAFINVNVMICDVDVVVKKGREFLFDAKIKVNANFDCAKTGAVITKVDQEDEYPERDYAMELYFGQNGQNSWDIAKEMKISEDDLITQNPETNFPLEQNENLILFYQKK